MPAQYPGIGFPPGSEVSLLRRICNNTALMAEGGGPGGGVTQVTAGAGVSVNQPTGNVTVTNTGVTQIIAGSGISVDQGTGAVTITATGGSGAVDSVFGRTGIVTAEVDDYSGFYGKLNAANSWTGVNTFAGSFIFTPATITIAANAGTWDITKGFSVATNGANTTLNMSAGGTDGQQIYLNAVNSDGANARTWTINNPSGADPTFTAAAGSTTAIKLQSNGTSWSIIGGAPTINDLSTVAAAAGDFIALWDISAGSTIKAAVSTIVSAALTGTPATVPQGGTGLATLTSGALLVGAGTGNVAFITPGAGVAAALAVAVGTAGAPVLFNGALGTPSSATLTNATGLPMAALVAGILAGNMTLGESTGQIVLDPALSADGTWSGIMEAGTAGATLAFGDLVYFQASDSRWELVDADAEATSGPLMLGMCVLAAASDGSATNILRWGKIRADANFPALTIGAPAYASTTTGDIQTAQPSGTDDVIRIVGYGVTADVLLFQPSNDYMVHT